MKQARQIPTKPCRRRASIMIGVLVSLVVVTVLVAGWANDGLTRNGNSRKAEYRLQADWLAESGLDRAAARLAADRGYTGEVWTITPAELSALDGGRVEIHVAASSAGRRISVAADYPADPLRRCRITKKIDLEPQK